MNQPGANALVKPLDINSRAKHCETGLRRVKMLGFSGWGLPIASRQWATGIRTWKRQAMCIVFYRSQNGCSLLTLMLLLQHTRTGGWSYLDMCWLELLSPVGSCVLTLDHAVEEGCAIPGQEVPVGRRRPPWVTLECLAQHCFLSNALCVLYTKMWTSHVLRAHRRRPSHACHVCFPGTKLWTQVNISSHNCLYQILSQPW